MEKEIGQQKADKKDMGKKNRNYIGEDGDKMRKRTGEKTGKKAGGQGRGLGIIGITQTRRRKRRQIPPMMWASFARCPQIAWACRTLSCHRQWQSPAVCRHVVVGHSAGGWGRLGVRGGPMEAPGAQLVPPPRDRLGGLGWSRVIFGRRRPGGSAVHPRR